MIANTACPTSSAEPVGARDLLSWFVFSNSSWTFTVLLKKGYFEDAIYLFFSTHITRQLWVFLLQSYLCLPL